ncbi:MAG: pantoate--beta-alanine ligase [Zetaproteobacteria bacterium]|nr:MAG: pantoate--beta-alanine ligase [Zetaproteobacteria bacterium]
MRVAHNPTEIQQSLGTLRKQKSIAFVPTMGNLHDGHLKLIAKARELADIVVTSIYVNPLQFGPEEDFDTYPRTFEEDAKKCQASGVDFIFHPDNLYTQDGPKVTLCVDTSLSVPLCGSKRPGHFNGVATVVNLLFNIVQPDFALFGEKDWQQLVIIRRMVQDLHMPVTIVGVPTQRESDGLAMSSRNRYLTPDERLRAASLSRCLHTIRQGFHDGESDSKLLLERGRNVLAGADIEPEYLEICDEETLEPLPRLSRSMRARAFVAARIGKARLIDNMPLYTMEAINS